MEGYDWEKLEETVRDIRENTVSERSRDTYKNSYCRFLPWTARNKQHLVPPSFLEILGDISEYRTEKQLRARVKEVVDAGRSIQPLSFIALEAKDFITWLVTLKKTDGGKFSYSALNTHRAALFNLFRGYGHIWIRPARLR